MTYMQIFTLFLQASGGLYSSQNAIPVFAELCQVKHFHLLPVDEANDYCYTTLTEPFASCWGGSWILLVMLLHFVLPPVQRGRGKVTDRWPINCQHLATLRRQPSLNHPLMLVHNPGTERARVSATGLVFCPRAGSVAAAPGPGYTRIPVKQIGWYQSYSIQYCL